MTDKKTTTIKTTTKLLDQEDSLKNVMQDIYSEDNIPATMKIIKEFFPETADTPMKEDETNNEMYQQDRIRKLMKNLDQIIVVKTPEVKTGEDKTCGRIPEEDRETSDKNKPMRTMK